VIALSSHGHIYAPKPHGILFETLRTSASDLSAYTRYGQSKLAAILWVRHMAQEYPQLTFASIHPGLVNTGLMDNATATPAVIRSLTKMMGGLLKTPDQGARNQLWASVGAGVNSGSYYEPIGVADVETAIGKDARLAKTLFDWTETQLNSHVSA
jgi:NAD(P)-dependent dehydrogenase (short-subunit alcohol dehydrogenase family)